VDARTGQIAPAKWINREKKTLRIPLKDSVIAVMDSSYLDWNEAPAELTATLSGHDVHLTWKRYKSGNGFELQRSRDWGPWEKVTELPASQNDYAERLPRGSHITYRVRMTAAKQPSAWSNPAWVDISN
jgi:hypothetical protein